MTLLLIITYLCFVIAVGAAASIQEIENEGLNLKLCQRCQEVIMKSKNLLGTTTKIVIPKSSDRANRVLRFMDSYLERLDVQVAALDAILSFCRNADAKGSVKETDVIPILVKCLQTHKKEVTVMWRVCMALAILASYHSDIAVNITTTSVHELAIDEYATFKEYPIVQQQILWMFSAFIQWPRSQREIHKSLKCVNFLKSLVQKPEDIPQEQQQELDQSKALEEIEMEEKQIVRKMPFRISAILKLIGDFLVLNIFVGTRESREPSDCIGNCNTCTSANFLT